MVGSFTEKILLSPPIFFALSSNRVFVELSLDTNKEGYWRSFPGSFVKDFLGLSEEFTHFYCANSATLPADCGALLVSSARQTCYRSSVRNLERSRRLSRVNRLAKSGRNHHGTRAKGYPDVHNGFETKMNDQTPEAIFFSSLCAEASKTKKRLVVTLLSG